MREDLICELRGAVLGKDGKPAKGYVEFLPEFPTFTSDSVTYTPLGGRKTLDSSGCFTVLLTRTDRSRIPYVVIGAAGRWLITLEGPGPHNLREVLSNPKRSRRLAPERRM